MCSCLRLQPGVCTVPCPSARSLAEALTRGCLQVLVAERGHLVLVANLAPESYYESLQVAPGRASCLGCPGLVLLLLLERQRAELQAARRRWAWPAGGGAAGRQVAVHPEHRRHRLRGTRPRQQQHGLPVAARWALACAARQPHNGQLGDWGAARRQAGQHLGAVTAKDGFRLEARGLSAAQ